MTPVVPTGVVIPPVLASYHELQGEPLVPLLLNRAHVEPFNVVATAIFFLAILHTFAAARFTRIAHRVQARHADRARAAGRADTPSVAAEALHFLGEVEVVFGLWAIVLLAAMAGYAGWETAAHYFNERCRLHRAAVRRGHHGPGRHASDRLIRRERAATCRAAGTRDAGCVVVSILTIGPMLGSFITEPGAMTISRAPPGPPVLQPSAGHALEVRDARPAVRQRVNRRHPDAFRRSAHPDGLAAVDMGYSRSCSGTSAGGRCGNRSLDDGVLPGVPARARGAGIADGPRRRAVGGGVG